MNSPSYSFWVLSYSIKTKKNVVCCFFFLKKRDKRGYKTNPYQQCQQLAVLTHASEQHNAPYLSRPSHLKPVIAFSHLVRAESNQDLPGEREALQTQRGHPSWSFLSTQEANGMPFPMWKPTAGPAEDAAVHANPPRVAGCLICQRNVLRASVSR